VISHGFEIEHSAESSPKYLPNFFRLFISNNAYLHVGVPDVYLFESLISSIPRTICNSIAQKFSVDGLVMRWSPADVQRCRRRIMRSCDRRFSRGSWLMLGALYTLLSLTSVVLVNRTITNSRKRNTYTPKTLGL
jgi:hypothetical protein